MEAIFHEKQEGSLCAQHCLNALLQGNYFTAVDLAELARQLDDDERMRMAEAGVQSEEYRRFLEQPSSNFDDSGFFSIQVIQKAVSVWGLETLTYNSQDPIAIRAREDPKTMSAYICNFREHWFAIRHLGNQWFNLNSLLTSPELISNTYLSMFLTQLQQEGYSIFIVLGELPECEADQLLKLVPAIQPIKPRLITDTKRGATEGAAQDDEFSQAMNMSRQMADSEDSALQKALSMSMQGFEDYDLSGIQTDSSSHIPQPNSLSGATPGPLTNPPSSDASEAPPSAEELRQKRLAFLEKQEKGESSEPQPNPDDTPTPPATQTRPEPEGTSKPKPASEMSEEEMIQEAIKLSMQAS